MFYLLEDNRIIDSQIPYAHAKSLPFWEDKVGHLRAKDRTGKSYQVFKYDKIIKRSENVLDLTKCGDLIKFQQTLTFNNIVLEQFVLLNENNIEHLLNAWQCSYSDILAIYKPDKKGNYIKVWERKEE